MSKLLEVANDPERIGLLPHEKADKSEVPSWTAGNYKINWINSAVIFLPPLLVLGAIIYGVPLTWSTFIIACIFYNFNGLGITVGYHRLFSHRSFTATKTMQWFLSFAGAGAAQGSVLWWARNHRIHHNYIDGDKDPYDANKGFLYSHIGWMIMKQNYKILGYVDISDMKANKILRINHAYYFPIMMLSGIILPTLACGLWSGDWLGGYFYAALAKVVCVHHSTFFINSLAHSSFFGAERLYSENHTAHDSWFCSLLAFGEGFHNYHHEFSQDYRNGLRWYDWDPTKWTIRLLEIIGHAKNLVRVPNSVIDKNRASVRLNKAQREVATASELLAKIDQEVATPSVTWTWADVEKKCEEEGRKLMVVGNYVLDMEKKIQTGDGYTHKNAPMDWCKVHPGGAKILEAYVGKDATDAMTGGVYKHSEGAFNLVQHLRVASIKREDHGQEEE